MTDASLATRNPASYRDPSGFVYHRNGSLLRQVNPCYRNDYEQLIGSGLYDELSADGLLVPHQEAPLDWRHGGEAYKVLRPSQLPFISYPYEWSFSQLRDAALLTLAIQRKALAKGMILKDASAYNVQLFAARPVWIDTLSFEQYIPGRPWVAYGQFCRHFLAPLALMCRTDVRLGQLLRVYIDGVPLDLASRLLPWRSKFSLSLGLHVHAHARSQLKHAHAAKSATVMPPFSRRKFELILTGLEQAVEALKWNAPWTEWGDYYAANNNYGDAGLQIKQRLVRELLDHVRPRTVWDLGANNGRFSRIAVQCGAETVVAWDIDPACVDHNYRQVVQQREAAMHPLLLDLTNPSPGVGWAGAERSAFLERGPVDAVLALGLVHHLAISNNVPLEQLAQFFAKLGRWLLIEWVPKDDSQVQKLLATRKDVFPAYTQSQFEEAFRRCFGIERILPLGEKKRTLYLLKSAG